MAACWWRHFGGGRAARVLPVSGADGEALCPMVMTPYAVGPGRVRVLEFLGGAPAERRFSARTFGHADINRVLGDSAAISPTAVDAIFQAPGWQAARLRNLPGRALDFVQAWERARGPFPGRAVQREDTLAARLDGTWAAYVNDARKTA